MSWLFAIVGFAFLVILHEAGHFTAAKLVGMRVERFALFFPPLIAKVRRGETEYGIGSIPLGGYVRITGMNPNEEIPPEVAHRAYYRQAVWKRVVAKQGAGQRDLTTPGVRDNITATLRGRREQLLRTAYLEAARNKATVVNHLARQLVESQGKLSSAPALLRPNR